MWSVYGSFFVKLLSMIVLSAAVTVNGIGSLFGTGNIIETEQISSYIISADGTSSLQSANSIEAADTENAASDVLSTVRTIELESDNKLYIRSSFRKLFNRYFDALGMKNAVSATDVEIDRKNLSLPAGTTANIDADILPSNARNKNVRFESDTPSVASVSPYGVVKGLKPGSATVYVIAEDGGFYKKCNITVTRGAVPCTSVILSASGVSLQPEATETISFEVFPINTTDGLSLIVSDLDTVKASLSDGVLTLTGKAPGIAIVTVRCGDVFGTVYVTVSDSQNDPSLDAEGVLSIFGGSSSSNIGTVIRSVDSLSDGGYIACGTTASENGSFSGLYNSDSEWKTPYSFVAKFTEYGTVEWIKLFGDSSASVMLYDIAVLADGNIVTVGTYEYPSTYTQTGGIDAVIITLSPKGGQLSRNILEGSGDDFFYSVAATSDGYVAGGKTNSTNGAFEGIPGMSSVIFNFSLDHTVLWKRYFNASKSSHIADIDVDSENNIFLSCITTATDGYFASVDGLFGSYADTVIFKFGISGDYIWHHVLATSGTDLFESIAADGNGGCYVAGNYTLVSTVSADGTLEGIHNCGGTDALVFRLDENGERQWYHILSGFYDDFITDIVRTENGIGVTGYTNSSNREFSSVGNLGGTDAFVSLYYADGNVIKLTAQAGSKDDAGLCIAYSQTENEVFVAGRTKSSDGSFADNTNGNSIVGYTGKVKVTT